MIKKPRIFRLYIQRGSILNVLEKKDDGATYVRIPLEQYLCGTVEEIEVQEIIKEPRSKKKNYKRS